MKKIPGILAGVSVFCLMAFIGLQGDKIEGLQEELGVAALRLEDSEMRLENVTEEKLLLEKEVAELQEEIKQLKEKVVHLERDLSEYREKLRNLRKRIEKLSKKVTTLEKEIAQLKQSGSNNTKKIKELEAQKQQLEQEIQYHINKEKVIIEVQDETEVEIEAAETEANDLNNLRDLILSANVKFHQVDLWKNEGAGSVKKVKRKDKRWKYTGIQLSIEHTNSDILKDLDFVLKILDLDTGRILPYNESNPEYPNSAVGTNGYLFKYHGNLAEVLYYNNEIKEGMNYEARVYVRINGEDMPMTNGKLPIIKHGRAVGIPADFNF